jgi:hypothetical protein
MTKCSKCGVEKDESNYYKYYHSTQQKWRVRKECNECHYKQRLKNKNPDLYYQNNPDYKKCLVCKEWKTITQYYFQSITKNKRFAECCDCNKEKNRVEREQYLIENGGSERVPQTPNIYTDEYQKHHTFSFLQLLGYTYNEEFGIWIKPGFKELIDGKIVFPNIDMTVKKPKHKSKTYVSDETFKKIIEYKNAGWSIQKIEEKLNISDTTIYTYYTKWKNTLK